MKKLKFIAMLLAALFVSTCFSSCSKDDDDASPLVGTWVMENEHTTFNSDGTGKSWLKDEDGEIREEMTFKWVTEDTKVTLSFDKDEYGEAKILTFYWKMENGKLMVSETPDFADADVLTKKDPIKPSNGNNPSELIGTWDEETDDTYEVLHVTFNADGTGEFWATGDDFVDTPSQFSWTANGNKLTQVYKYEDETATGFWKIENGKLYASDNENFIDGGKEEEGECIVYVKRK